MVLIVMEFSEKFIERNIADLTQQYDCVFASNVNLSRMIPDLIDGLKIVQRRTIYTMYTENQGKEFRKVASISGQVFGSVHPHGTTSIDGAIVSMGQKWRNLLPLIESKGNYGAIDGSPAGASRYIQAALSEYCRDLYFSEWQDSVVDSDLAYDEKTMMPRYLPAKYPHILICGARNIGHMGVSCYLPSFNFREVMEATIKLIADPKANIVLIPDSPTGADIIETDFAKICTAGRGSYMQRCTYKIDDQANTITITTIPDGATVNDIRTKIAEMKESGKFGELVGMNDYSGAKVNLELQVRSDVNPYKFIKKLISDVAGLQVTYPIVVTIVNNYHAYDWSIKDVLLNWIKWRREQKRLSLANRRANLTAEQRINDIKLFIMNEKNLKETVNIFHTSHNRAEIEERLIKRYRDTAIKLDSLQARTLSNMRMVELSLDAYAEYKKKAEELIKQLEEMDEILNTENGVNKIIVAELREGIKKWGAPRRSNVVPMKINTSNEVEGHCILQLSSDGMITRKIATNVEEEPIPNDNNGFACLVDNESSFVIVGDDGSHTFVRAKDLPVDKEVPLNRYCKKNITGKIVAMLPVDIDSNMEALFISKRGLVKRIKINDLGPTKKPMMALTNGDKIVRGIQLRNKDSRELLVYTKEGLGQRLNISLLKTVGPQSSGTPKFRLGTDDEIVGFYVLESDQNQYIVYTTSKGKMRLNNLEYLPSRSGSSDFMQLVSLARGEKLISITGCNGNDKILVYFDDGTSDTVKISDMKESTMAAPAKKMVDKDMVKSSVVKTKLI